MAVPISVRALSHSYVTSTGRLAVLDGVDLSVPAGAHVTLTGPSGSGKSTLLSLLGGLDRPQAGSVVVGEHDLSTLAGDGLAAYRRSTVGVVFQHFGLLDMLTAAENVELALTLAGVPGGRRTRRALGLLDALCLAERRAPPPPPPVGGGGPRGGHPPRRPPHPPQLWGGGRQRVAIARALANEPQLVLADEPTGNLDEESALMVAALLETLPAGHDCTLVLVTHNRALSARAPLQFRLVDGRLELGALRP